MLQNSLGILEIVFMLTLKSNMVCLKLIYQRWQWCLFAYVKHNNYTELIL
jgi:hypothetical protein